MKQTKGALKTDVLRRSLVEKKENNEFDSSKIIDVVTQYGSEFGVKLIGAIAIFIIGKMVAKWLKKVFTKAFNKANVDATLTKFIVDVIYTLMLIFIVIAALSTLGVPTTSFVAILGAVGLSIGLAFKDTFANIGAGVLLIVFRPFKIGDFVEVAGVAGVVEEINIFNVLIKTGDNKSIIVPNSKTIGDNIVNYSKKPTRRVDLVFGIGYDDDLKLAKQTLVDIVSADDRVLKDPAPFVAVSELADSSVNFVVRAWVNSADYWGVHFDTLEKVKLVFDEKGISIPYPQMDIHQDK